MLQQIQNLGLFLRLFFVYKITPSDFEICKSFASCHRELVQADPEETDPVETDDQK